MKSLAERILSGILTVAMIMGIIFVPTMAAEEKLNDLVVSDINLGTDGIATQKNLFDANENNVALFDAEMFRKSGLL